MLCCSPPWGEQQSRGSFAYHRHIFVCFVVIVLAFAGGAVSTCDGYFSTKYVMVFMKRSTKEMEHGG